MRIGKGDPRRLGLSSAGRVGKCAASGGSGGNSGACASLRALRQSDADGRPCREPIRVWGGVEGCHGTNVSACKVL
jgi:hypothetical protein